MVLRFDCGRSVTTYDRPMGNDGEEIVRLESVTKYYGAKKALEDTTLRCPKKDFTAVLGPPGAGKTTLLRCAAGLDRPTAVFPPFGACALRPRPQRPTVGFNGLSVRLGFEPVARSEVE